MSDIQKRLSQPCHACDCLQKRQDAWEEIERLTEENKTLTTMRERALYDIDTAMRRIDQLEEVVEAAAGLNFGEDWNNGTHAKIYKPKLRAALDKLDKATGEG